MEKKIKILVIISVILIILGPILGLLLNKIPLDSGSKVIPDTSNTDINDAYAYNFTLVKGQKIVVEFSVYTEDVTANLIILGKGTYDDALAAATAPGSVSGEKYFIYSQFAFGQSPASQSGSDDIRTITEDGYWYVEFAGATTGDYLISIPGEYAVIIYGTNSGGTNVFFNVEIKIDGPGEIVGMLVMLVGIGALVAIMILGTVGYLKKTGRGLL